MTQRSLRLGVALALVSAAALGGAQPAAGADLEQIRARAQNVADEVTVLEHRLARLNRAAGRLEDAIAAAGAAIGVEEIALHEATTAASEARDRFIARAVEAYKDAGAIRLELMLSARTITQLLTVAQATASAAETDAAALEEYLAARDSAARRQNAIDEHKQRLLAHQSRIEQVHGAVASAITARRARMRELARHIARLEEQARAAAAAAASPSDALLDLLQPSGPAPDIPDGFVGTGVTFEGVASWYGPGFEGNPTASGDIFDPDLFTAASKDLPLGTWLFVVHEGKGVVVYVNDRGPYVDGRILDLSHAAAEAIGITGLGWIEAEILVQED